MRTESHWKVVVKVARGKHCNTHGPYFLNGKSEEVTAIAVRMCALEEYSMDIADLKAYARVSVGKVAYRD